MWFWVSAITVEPLQLGGLDWGNARLAWRNRNHHLRWFNGIRSHRWISIVLSAMVQQPRAALSLLVPVFCKMENEYVLCDHAQALIDLGRIRTLTRILPYSLFRGQGGHQGQRNMNVRIRRDRRMDLEEHRKRKCWTLRVRDGCFVDLLI